MFRTAKYLVLAMILAASNASAQTYVKLWPNGTTGTIDADGESVIIENARGMASLGITVTGTFTGDMVIRCSVDGTNFVSSGLTLTPFPSGMDATTISAAGAWQTSIQVCRQVEIIATSWSSGSADVSLSTTQVPLTSTITADLSGASFDGNAAASATGAAVPADAGYTGINVGGNLVGQTGVTVGSANAASVAIVDGSGNQITTFGGGTQYTEGDTDASITGTAVLFEGGSDTLTAVSASTPLPVGDAGGSLTVDNGGTFAVQAAQSGTWNITNVSGTVSLPTGAATAANQSTANTSLSNIDGKLVTQRTADYDSGAGTVTTNFIGIAVPASGGPVAGGTSSNPIRTDPTGTTTQPISDAGGSLTVDGTVAATQSGTWNVGTVSTVSSVTAVDAVTSITNVVHVDDNSSTISVDDGGGSLTVDGTVTVTDGAGALNVIVDSGTVAVTDGGGSLTVDGTISCSNCSGSGVSVNEDVASANADPGTPAYTVRNDTVTGATSADGDYQPIKSDSAGRIYVTGSGGTFPVTDSGGSLTVDGTVAATQSGTWSVRAQDGSGNALTSAARGSERALSVQLVDGSGNQITSFGNGQTEDAAHTTGDGGSFIMGIRRDTTPSSSAGAAGDYTAINVDANGRTYTNSALYTPAGDSAMNDTADAVKTLAVDATGTTITPNTRGVQDTALGTITSVSGFLTMCRGSAAAPTAVSADDDATLASCTRQGILRVQVENIVDDAAFTVGTSNTIPIAGTYKSTRDAVDDGDAGTLAMNSKRGLYVSPETPNGDSIVNETADAIKALLVDTSGTALTADTQLTHDGGLTPASTTGSAFLCRAGTDAPSGVSADDDAALVSCTRAGIIRTATLDPCGAYAKTTTPISLTTDTVIITATASKKNYICSISIIAGAAEVVSITEGTGTVCGTGEAALVGSTTDANGMSFAANGGFAAIGSNATVIAGKTANVDTCMNVSGSNRVSGFVTWVQAP